MPWWADLSLATACLVLLDRVFARFCTKLDANTEATVRVDAKFDAVLDELKRERRERSERADTEPGV